MLEKISTKASYAQFFANRIQGFIQDQDSEPSEVTIIATKEMLGICNEAVFLARLKYPDVQINVKESSILTKENEAFLINTSIVMKQTWDKNFAFNREFITRKGEI